METNHIAVGNKVFIGASGSPVRARIVTIGTGALTGWATVEVTRMAVGREGQTVFIPGHRAELQETLFPTYDAAYEALRAKGW